MKVEIITDAKGTPLAAVVDAAHASEIDLLAVAVDQITIPLPPNTKVLSDKAGDSDALRDRLADADIILVSPHRSNRKRPSRNDGRTLRRYKRRWIVERTLAWFHSYRRAAVRYDVKHSHYEGFVSLACAFMTLRKLVVK